MIHTSNPRETKCRWQCRRMLHAGDGPPERDGTVMGVHPMDAAEAAEYYAEVMDDKEMRETGGNESDFDGGLTLIEVETELGWRRFSVTCRVVRQYTATEER